VLCFCARALQGSTCIHDTSCEVLLLDASTAYQHVMLACVTAAANMSKSAAAAGKGTASALRCEVVPRGYRVHLSYQGHGVELHRGVTYVIPAPTPSAKFVISMFGPNNGTKLAGSYHGNFPDEEVKVWEHECQIDEQRIVLRWLSSDEATARGVTLDHFEGMRKNPDDDDEHRSRTFQLINRGMRAANEKWELTIQQAALKNEIAVVLSELEAEDLAAASVAASSSGAGKSAALEETAKQFAKTTAAMPAEVGKLLAKYFKILDKKQIKSVFWSVLRNGMQQDTRLILWICCLSLPSSESRNTLMLAVGDAFTTDTTTLVRIATTLAAL